MVSALERGTVRVGSVYDGDPTTPMKNVVLRRNDRAIWLEIPWTEAQDHHKTWFDELEGVVGGEQPNLPQQLVFEDSKGPVVLMGIHIWASGTNLVSGHGTGKLRCDYAVPGSRSMTDYTRPHGLMSRIDGLHQFVRLRAVELEFGDRKSAPHQLTARLSERPSITISESHGLKFAFGYRITHPGFDSVGLQGYTSVATEVAEGSPMQDHLKVHRAISALLGVTYGRAAGFLGHSIRRVDDRDRMVDGNEGGSPWRELITDRTGIGDIEPLDQPRLSPLFSFADIGVEGVHAWLRLWDEWPRAMLPLAGLVRMRSTFLEAQFAQLGIGLEGLGYYLAREAGLDEKHADDLTLERKLERITDVLPFAEAVVGPDWARRVRDLYIALKHPKYAYPDMEATHAAFKDSVKLYRLWVAQKLAVSIDETLLART